MTGTRRSFSGTTNAPAYRPEIDGLRAIAVLVVLGFHAFPNIVRGGYIGVDIFFVISGFLISGIIYRELDHQHFSYARFYARRIKRIFPALIVVLLGCYLAGRYFFLADEQAELDQNIVASAAFVSNLFLLTRAGYFNESATTNPLLHLWSLGIEEQFYLVWPIVLAFIFRHRKASWVLPGLFAASLIANLVLIGRYPVSTFYLPVSRFWELCAGAFLAHVAHQQPALGPFGVPLPSALHFSPNDRIAERISWIAPYLGVSLVLFATFAFSATDPYPGWRAIVPVAAATLLIAGPRASIVNRVVLTNPIVVFVGKISFPLYLWHWPLLAFLRIGYEHTEAPKEQRALALLLAMVLASLTYRLIERPIRFGSPHPLKPILLGIAMIVMAVLGGAQWYAVAHQDDAQGRYVQFFKNYVETHDLAHLYRFDCALIDTKGRPVPELPPSCIASKGRDAIFVWGDSHAQTLRDGLVRMLPDAVSLMQVATFGCRPSIEAEAPDRSAACNRANRISLETIRRVRPTVVILSQASRHEETDWQKIALTLRSIGVERVVLLGPFPQWHPALYRTMARELVAPRPTRLSTSLIHGIVTSDRILHQRYDASPTITYASVMDVMCNHLGCLTYLDNDEEGLTTFDYGHLTLSASTLVARQVIAPAIKDIASFHLP